ncbi:Ankyrin repeat and SOCS box protein 9 [Phlyctochytrium bullatum]|nr:Ankyrin repeat and SOCS box protein 9 [Phlyctochytrium bullatum]
MVTNVPFRKLPDLYGVAWMASCWDCMADPACERGMDNAMQCMMVAFPELQQWSESYHGPHLPVAWMERIVLKALDVVRVKFCQECMLAVSLAAFLDSVPVVKSTLYKLFPEEMASEGSAAGAREVVVAANLDWPGNGPLHAADKIQQSFAWCMALVAEDAAKNGAVHMLDYALQHPLVPVAFSFSRKDSKHFGYPFPGGLEFLMTHASRKAHMHVVHYLLGNPLPLAPPPASRPIRPGRAADGPKHGELEPSYKTRTRLGKHSVLLSPVNPVASLILCDTDDISHLDSLLGFRDHDPIRAVTYLVDQGAPPNGPSLSMLGPIHHAAHLECPGIVRLLVERGAEVDAHVDHRGRPLYFAAAQNNVTCVLELLECGADRDALNFPWGREHQRGGITALNVALKEESYDVARLLLNSGATLLRVNREGDEHIDEELLNQLLE